MTCELCKAKHIYDLSKLCCCARLVEGIFLKGFKPFAWRDWVPLEKNPHSQIYGATVVKMADGHGLQPTNLRLSR